MAALQLDSGRIGEAEKTLLKLTSLAPDYADGFTNLSVLHLRKRELDKAMAAADRAIAISPESFGAFFNKAEVFMMRGDYAAARDHFSKVVQLRPDFGPATLNLSLCYQATGDLAGARQVLDAYLTRFGNTNSPYLSSVRARLATLGPS
jgi:tetratricopeptide (TPR) repeat protein